MQTAVSLAPAMLHPQVPIDDRRMYPVYAKCVELDLPAGSYRLRAWHGPEYRMESLQVVVTTKVINGNSGPPRVLATNFW